MDKEYLRVGIYNNFRELCVVLGLIDKGCKKRINGNTKKRLDKEIRTVCNYYKSKDNKLFVIEIFYKKKDKVDHRFKDNIFITKKENQKIDGRSKNNVYVDLVEKILLNNLNNYTSKISYISVFNLINTLGFTNKNFKEFRYNNNDLDYYTINSFKRILLLEAKRILDRSLKSMAKRNLIDFNFETVITFNKYKDNNNIKVANNYEEFKIVQTKKIVLQHLHCKSYHSVIFRNKLEEYNELMKKELEKDIQDFKSSFNAYVFNSVSKSTVDPRELKQLKEKLNKLFVTRMQKVIQQKHKYSKNKQLKEFENLAFGDKTLKYEATDDYILNTNKLIETYISI